MCTVTVVPHGTGIRLVCNRDERRSRLAAVPPAHRHVRGTRALFPIDPEGGGTWIGVNDAGLAVTLLNTHPTVRGAGPATANDARTRRNQPTDRHRREGAERSRGLIVRALLGCKSLAEASATAAGVDASAFGPFCLLILHARSLVVAASDVLGPPTRNHMLVQEPLLFTSSSLGDAMVEPPRRRLFERLVLSRRDGWLEGQARFHRHQWRSRREISVLMEREDALTVSRTAIDLVDRRVRLMYDASPLGRAGLDVLEWSFSL